VTAIEVEHAVSDFKVQALEQLTDQVRFAPPGVRQEQLDRARALMAQVRGERSYPYQFVVYRITNFRSDDQPNLLIQGDELRHDLDLFTERVARTLQTGFELPAEPMFSLEQVSQKLNVSTKTVSRWRKHGLIGQHVMQNGRKQLAFSQSVVERFVESHPREVARGSKFSHLSLEEKDEIIRRARRLANVGGSLTDVSKRIAHTLGRSPEAVRYTIKNHDREYPSLAVFPTANGPLNPDAKLQIFNSYRKGIAVETLAKQFHRTRSSIHKVINEVKADKLLKAPVDYIMNEEFNDSSRASTILGPMPDEDGFQEQLRHKKVPRDVPAEMAHLYEYPLLSKEQEQHLFRQMNYLKHQLYLLQGDLAPNKARSQDIDRIEELQAKIGFVRDILRMRAGLDNEENLTLEEIGKRMGITKERVRQLNVRIMKKLREYVQQHKMDM